MNHTDIISKLESNLHVFKALLSGIPNEETLWRPAPEKWCLLEIVCHILDEEREDFRARLMHTLENPEAKLPSIDPQGWVRERNYAGQNYEQMLEKFFAERKQSIHFLRSLKSPAWNNAHNHPKFGALSAKMFLSNWLAHDYLHFRQITSVKYHYLVNNFETRFDYAGNW